jgi:Trypsin
MPRRLIRCLALAALGVAVLAGAAASAVRVVGGTSIQIQAAPWAVFVESVAGSAEYVCSGSVIDASHVLTAAHCLYDEAGNAVPVGSLTVMAGVSNVVAPSPTDAEQERSVSAVRVHPGYVHTTTDAADDVAVLTLAAPLDLSGPDVQAVALPAPNAPFPAQAVVSIAGFGRQDPAMTNASGALESMTATIDWQGDCDPSGVDTVIEFDDAVALCQSSPTSSICQGDSGAGLIDTNGPPTLVGVVNAAPAGCPIGGHGVSAYVGAPEILSFIEGNDQPPIAPRASAQTATQLTWAQPLVPGDALTCSTAGWPGPVQIAYSFLDGSSGAVLQAGPAATYRLPASAGGRTVFCEAAVTNSGGTAVVYTIATPKIAPVPRLRITLRAAHAVGQDRKVTLRVVLDSPPGLSGTFRVCATAPVSVEGHVCRSTHVPFGASGSFRFALTFRIRPNARLGAARIAISASAGLASAKATESLRVVKA